MFAQEMSLGPQGGVELEISREPQVAESPPVQPPRRLPNREPLPSMDRRQSASFGYRELLPEARPVEHNGEWILIFASVSIAAAGFLVLQKALPLVGRWITVQTESSARQENLQTELLRDVVKSSNDSQRVFFAELLGEWKQERVADREAFAQVLQMAVETQEKALAMQVETRGTVASLQEAIKSLERIISEVSESQKNDKQALDSLVRQIEQLGAEIDVLTQDRGLSQRVNAPSVSRSSARTQQLQS